MNNRTQQLAVLLNIMGEDSAKNALANFDDATSAELKNVLKEFQADPPTSDEVQFVLDDFERYFNFAIKQLQEQNQLSPSATKPNETDDQSTIEKEEESYNATFGAIITFSKPKLTGDTKHDLNLLHPYQVAFALRNDNPNSIAVVIKSLTDAHAGQTMENLPPEVRLEVFLRMAEPIEITQEVQQQILDATLQSALKVESRVPDIDRTGQMVALARSIPKNIRGPLLEKLTENNKELSESVKDEMYQFEDILKLEDRDIQKVLGQSDTDALVLALVQASSTLREKLLNNMSKRARQTIEEELEFKTNAKEEEIVAGKKEIVAVLRRMDEDGEISLE